MSRTRAQARVKEAVVIAKPSVPADVVGYLRRQKGMTLRQIAKLTGTTESFISRVARGERNLTVDHLYMIETHLKEPLPLLLLRAMPRESFPESLQPLYDKAAELLKALGESRRPFSVPVAGEVEARRGKGKSPRKVPAVRV